MRICVILVMILICATGAFLDNFFAFCMSGILVPPLFLDTILIVSVTLVWGLKWGMLCGVLHNVFAVIMQHYHWTIFLFAICCIAVACVVFLFTRFFPAELNLVSASSSRETHQLYKSSKLNELMSLIIALILLSFVLAISISILGGIISTIINMINRSAEVMETITPQSTKLTGSMFPSDMQFLLKEILVRIPINIIDRLITVFAGYGIARLICAVKNKSSSMTTQKSV